MVIRIYLYSHILSILIGKFIKHEKFKKYFFFWSQAGKLGWTRHWSDVLICACIWFKEVNWKNWNFFKSSYKRFEWMWKKCKKHLIFLRKNFELNYFNFLTLIISNNISYQSNTHIFHDYYNISCKEWFLKARNWFLWVLQIHFEKINLELILETT